MCLIQLGLESSQAINHFIAVRLVTWSPFLERAGQLAGLVSRPVSPHASRRFNYFRSR